MAASRLRNLIHRWGKPWAVVVGLAVVLGVVAGIAWLRAAATPAAPATSATSATPVALPLKGAIEGELYLPRSHHGKVPGAVVLHGSEGYDAGFTQRFAQALAKQGIAALALCYFGCAGRPATLHDINIDQVFRAIAYMDSYPAVKRGDVTLIGFSRGGELALLAGSQDPEPRAVVAYYGSPQVNGSFPAGARDAWVMNGAPFPTGMQIPVTQIRGPVLLFAGAEDRVWPSSFSADVATELANSHRPYGLTIFPNAGHAFGGPWASDYSAIATTDGGTAAGDMAAARAAWAQTLSFIKGLTPAYVAGPKLPPAAPGTTASAGEQGKLRLVVTPRVSLASTPLTIAISGLRAGQRVTLTVTSVDSRGFHWKSVSTYTAGPSGTVNPASAPSGGPSYSGVDAMGPVDFMASSSTSELVYYWDSAVPFTFDFTATSGTETASLTVQRSLTASIQTTQATLARDGFVGTYWAPLTSARPRPAVLLFGGSEGGLGGTLLAATLAGQGYPTLNIAYFKEPGLPQSLKDIPLEYFAKALRWLAARPGVDSRHLWVDGAYRGGDAALLLGVHYPGLVHGVVALVPSDAAGCSYPGCTGPAWTFHGRPVAYTRLFNGAQPTNPAALIPVAKIPGPVFLDCGGLDQVWSSCPFAHEVMAELAAARDPYPHLLMVSPQGGHGAALYYPPYEPGLAEAESGRLAGATPVANDLAWAAQWPRFLSFLKN